MKNIKSNKTCIIINEKNKGKSKGLFFDEDNIDIFYKNFNNINTLSLIYKLYKKYNLIVFIKDHLFSLNELKSKINFVLDKNLSSYHLIPGLSNYLYINNSILDIYNLNDNGISNLITFRKFQDSINNFYIKIPIPFKYTLKNFFVNKMTTFSNNMKHFNNIQIKLKNSKELKVPIFKNNHFIDLGDKEIQIEYFVDKIIDYFPFPKVIMLALSNTCNLQCAMCPYHSKELKKYHSNDYFKHKKYIKLELIKKIAAEVMQFPVSFHFGEFDEPLMHPNILEIVAILAKEAGKTLHITTNGSLWSKKISEQLIKNGLSSVSFSLDAINPETYKKIRKKGDLNKTVENILSFLELKEKYNPKINVNICIIEQPDSKNEIDQFIQFWKTKNIDSVSIYKLFELIDKENFIFEIKNKYYKEKKRVPCSALWDQTFIYPEGEVSLCCTTLGRVPKDGIISMGNIYNNSIQEIWIGEKYQSVRKDLINGNFKKIPYCKICTHWAATYQQEEILNDGTIKIYNENESFFYFSKK